MVEVLHVIDGLGPGGAERVLYTTVRRLKELGLSVRVVTVFEGRDHWRPAFEELGVHVSSLGAQGIRDLPGAAWALRRALGSGDPPDIVHTHLGSADFVGRAAGWSRRLPVVSTLHNPINRLEWPASDGPRWKVAAKQRLLHSAAGVSARVACSRVIAVSEPVRQFAIQTLRCRPDLVVVVPNPVDVGEFSTEGPDRPRAGLPPGMPASGPRLVCIGRVSPEKGLIDAVRSLPAVSARFSGVQLVAAGSLENEDWLERIRQEARRLGVAERLTVLGPRRDVAQLLAAADVVVQPSVYEGFGVAAAEAMMMARPCVVSRIKPYTDMFREGTDCLMAAPEDPSSLAAAILELLADPERGRRMGEEAHRALAGRVDPNLAAQRLLAVYRDVARAGRVR